MDSGKLLICYFSGTGNALSVATWIKNESSKMNQKVELHDISKGDSKCNYNLQKCTLIGFVSPTHGFNFPPIMFHFLLRFPKGEGQKVFIVNTRGGLKMGKYFLPGLSGMAQYVSALILLLKGYRIAGMHPIDLPSNWISLHPGLKQKVVKSIFKKRKEETITFALKMLHGKRDLIALKDIIQDLLITPIGILYYFFGRFMLAKSFISSTKCNNCGLCIASCPLKAIILEDERPFWTHKCESCMKCMNHCPERAIETAHGFLTIIVVLVNTVVLFYLYSTLNLGRWLNGDGFLPYVSSIVFDSIVFLLCIFAGYKIMHHVKRFKVVEMLITYSSLTKYAFWRRYNPRKVLKKNELN